MSISKASILWRRIKPTFKRGTVCVTANRDKTNTGVGASRGHCAVEHDSTVDVGHIAERHLKEATTAFTSRRDTIPRFFIKPRANGILGHACSASRKTIFGGDRTRSCANSVRLPDWALQGQAAGEDPSYYPVFSCPPAFAFKSAKIIGPSENSDCSVRLVRSRK